MVKPVLPVFHLPDRAKTVLAIGDIHDSPAIGKDRFYWVGKHANAIGCDEVVQIGDWATLDSLCSYVGNDTYSGRLKGTVETDFKSLEESHEYFERGLENHKCKKHITLGNHEDRIWSYQERNPEIYGMLSFRHEDILKSFKWGFTKFGEYHFVDGVGFIHIPLNIMGRPVGGINAEQTISNHTTHDIVCGHTHRFKFITSPKVGNKPRLSVCNLGCALPQFHVEDYAKHSQTGWSWGVTELVISNGMITDHAFISMTTLERKYG